jgi:hypothetical protein
MICSLLMQFSVKGVVQTPCGVANVEFIDPREPVRVSTLLSEFTGQTVKSTKLSRMDHM